MVSLGDQSSLNECLLDVEELPLDVIKSFVDLPGGARLVILAVVRSVLDVLDGFEKLF